MLLPPHFLLRMPLLLLPIHHPLPPTLDPAPAIMHVLGVLIVIFLAILWPPVIRLLGIPLITSPRSVITSLKHIMSLPFLHLHLLSLLLFHSLQSSASRCFRSFTPLMLPIKQVVKPRIALFQVIYLPFGSWTAVPPTI